MNFTASDPPTAPLDNESHPALPCVYPPQTDDDDDGTWLLFVLFGASVMLMMTTFASSVVYALRRKLLPFCDGDGDDKEPDEEVDRERV